MKPTEILAQIKRRLPYSTQRLVNVLGWDGALLFLKNHGREAKRRVYVPLEYNPKNGLFAGMTEETANALIDEFGGELVDFNTHKTMLASERYQLLIHDFQQRKFTVKMLSEKYKIPERSVRWVIKKYEP